MNWILKRKDNNAVIQLHSQYSWSDEHDWSGLAQSTPVRTLSGALVIQQGTKQAGRPIHLVGQNAWMARSELKQLQAMTAVPELQFALTHPDSRVFNVMFSRPAIANISPVKPFKPADERPTDRFRFDLHFMTV